MKTAVWTLRMTREESIISKFILYIFEKSTASTHTHNRWSLTQIQLFLLLLVGVCAATMKTPPIYFSTHICTKIRIRRRDSVLWLGLTREREREREKVIPLTNIFINIYILSSSVFSKIKHTHSYTREIRNRSNIS